MRKSAIFAIVALITSALAVTPARAATSPATGTLTCAANGSAALKPALSTTPTAAKVNLHGKGTFDSCNASGVTGGKKVINSGTIALSGSADRGLSCASLFSQARKFVKRAITLKLQNTTVDSHGQPHSFTVAAIALVAESIDPIGTGFAITGRAPQNGSGTAPFGNESVIMQLNLDNFVAANSCAHGIGSLSALSWSTSGGSSLTIRPQASGSLFCATEGTATFDRPVKPATIPVFQPRLEAVGDLVCDGSGVSGGAAEINAGTVEFDARLDDNVGCSNLFSTPLDRFGSRFDIHLQHFENNGFGYPVTLDVARVREKIDTAPNQGDGWILPSDPIGGSGAFRTEAAGMVFNVDNTDEVASCAAGSTALNELRWRATSGSQLTIHP